MRSKITPFNRYYYKDLNRLVNNLIGDSKNIFYITGEKLPNLIHNKSKEYFVLINVIGNLHDLQTFFENLRKLCANSTKIVVTYYNYLWEPLLKLAELLSFKKYQNEQNWLTLDTLESILNLTGFSVVRKGSRLLLPIYIPIISSVINKYFTPLPIINKLCLTNYIIAKPTQTPKIKSYAVSVIVPARNEAGNIENLIKRLPNIGRSLEIIFVEGHSKDNTWDVILRMIIKYKNKRLRAYQQAGIGKGDAVRLGVSKASGDIIIILDSDLSVPPEEIPKFYNSLAGGQGDFINGTRLIYPLEKQSMRFLNIIGNKVFGLLFTWILDQRFTDTLCGTKAFWNKDYSKIQKLREIFGDFDPYGDYELIFGAAKLNLKIVEIPIRYHARQYGTSNISRFTHGWMLFKMCLLAFNKFKIN